MINATGHKNQTGWIPTGSANIYGVQMDNEKLSNLGVPVPPPFYLRLSFDAEVAKCVVKLWFLSASCPRSRFYEFDFCCLLSCLCTLYIDSF